VLVGKVSSLTDLAERLRHAEGREDRDAELASLRDERGRLVERVTRLEADNERLVAELKRAAEVGEDVKRAMAHVEAATAKCKALEKENKLLRSATFDKVPVS
jgi:seryl-tRNA synthetase